MTESQLQSAVTRFRDGTKACPTRRISVSYGGLERIYDLGRGTTQVVKKRYVVVTEGDLDTGYTKRGSWSYVPAETPEEDAA